MLNSVPPQTGKRSRRLETRKMSRGLETRQMSRRLETMEMYDDDEMSVHRNHRNNPYNFTGADNSPLDNPCK